MPVFAQKNKKLEINISFNVSLPEEACLRHVHEQVVVIRKILSDRAPQAFFDEDTARKKVPSRCRILQIDDDVEDCDMLKELLSRFYNVEYSSIQNPVTAITKLKNGEINPDLIILDYNMPCMNGIEVLAELRRAKKLNKIPVNLFTTSCNAATVKQAKALGAFDCIIKPSSLDEVDALLHRMFAPVSKSRKPATKG